MEEENNPEKYKNASGPGQGKTEENQQDDNETEERFQLSNPQELLEYISI